MISMKGPPRETASRKHAGDSRKGVAWETKSKNHTMASGGDFPREITAKLHVMICTKGLTCETTPIQGFTWKTMSAKQPVFFLERV